MFVFAGASVVLGAALNDRRGFGAERIGPCRLSITVICDSDVRDSRTTDNSNQRQQDRTATAMAYEHEIVNTVHQFLLSNQLLPAEIFDKMRAGPSVTSPSPAAKCHCG
jgi:hypothetical protein